MKKKGDIHTIDDMMAPEIVLKDNMTSEVVSDTSRLTFVRACYDTADLYISFVCRDSDIWGKMTERDQHLWEEEAVEVFLDVDDEVNTYLEVEISPQNTLFDSALSSIPSISMWRPRPI